MVSNNIDKEIAKSISVNTVNTHLSFWKYFEKCCVYNWVIFLMENLA